jgi:succinate-semialdehyde dehydrogenase / glutarate-semialdehyde dehydrogenase
VKRKFIKRFDWLGLFNFTINFSAMPEQLVSTDPSTGKEIKSYDVYSQTKFEGILKQADKTFHEWRRRSFTERAEILVKIANEIRKEKDTLVKLATKEMGKPISQGYYEVEKCASTLEFYAENGAKFLADEIVKTDATKSYVSFQPLGPVLAIMPWNFPYWQAFRAMAPAVMAGNVIILKHASNVSGCALAIEQLIKKAGAPKGLLQTVLVPSSRIEKMIDDPRIAAVTLTGSTAAGSKVAEAAGRNLKKCVLELGGSDAYVILEDADLDVAIEITVRGRLVNSGQSCIAAKRLIVVKSIRKEFEKRFTEKMQAATYGDPMDEANKIGPMARKDLRDQLHKQVKQSIKKGAKLLCGGFIPKGSGAYYPPSVLTNVKKGMPAYDEEMFGPVGVIIEAKDEKDAMRIANDSIYGLGGGIISKNIARAGHLAANELQAGSCFVNDFVHSDQRLPFGGIKQSGFGRELGTYGIREFVNIKTVYIK